MSNPFDYINAINSGNKNIIEEEGEAGFNPWLTNRQMSYFQDTMFVANEMNAHHHLDKLLQFDFYINIVRPRKRFTKWSKTEHSDDLEAVAQYYGYSYDKAKAVLDILSDEKIKMIKTRLEKGGKK